MTKPKEPTHNINLDKIEEYGKKFPEHMIIGKALHYRGIRVEISHIDNDGNSPLDYLKAFQVLEAMIEPTHQEWAKRFQIACGNEWHEIRTITVENCWDNPTAYQCSCGATWGFKENAVNHVVSSNPTYTNPADILREVMKWKNGDEFIGTLFCNRSMFAWVIEVLLIEFIKKYITEDPPTTLLSKATLFKEGKK